jgi:hypothetical protein
MPDDGLTPPRERLYQVLYDKSFRRLKRRGLSDDDAARIAGEVAKQATERTKAPDFKSDKDFAGVVSAVCKELSEGRSYYDLIGQRPYLATGRIDRLVATARHVRPPVPQELALAAKKATGLERLSGGLAVMFMAVALAALGIWYALAVGVVVSAGSEVYVQTGMPASARKAAARIRLTRWLGYASLALLIYLGYVWLKDSNYVPLLGTGLAVFALFIAYVIPGLTLATLVGWREHKWREALEKKLAKEEAGPPGP